MARLIPQRPLSDLLVRLGLDLTAAEIRLRSLAPVTSHEHLDRLLTRIRAGNDGDRRGALFELKTLDEMRDEVLRELTIEHAAPCLQGKKVDFFVPSVGLGIEATACDRDAIQASEFPADEDVDEKTIQWRINAAGCGYSNKGFADTLAGHLARLVQEKCQAKVFTRLDFPVILLLDAFPNDLFERYAPRSDAEWADGFRREFAWAAFPPNATIVVKRYTQALGQSEVIAFPRSDDDRRALQVFYWLFTPGRLKELA